MRGRRLGRYELLDVLGTGGMGTVYRAHDVELGRDVAIKLLRETDPEGVARFEREARAAAALGHPNIVAVHDVGRDGDLRYFAMDLIRGRTADAIRPEPRRAAEIVRDAARAIQYAHERGVLHRDLKPGNILVSEDGRALVMDFGLARRFTDSTARLTATGEVFGTPHYMSAEVAAGREADVRTDIWGLGATLYALLAGRAPFDGGEIYDVLRRVVHEDPPPSGGPPELDAIAMKCIEKNPSARYATAKALAADLDNWLDGRPVMAKPVGQLTRLGRRARRNPAITVAGALALLAVAVAGGFAGARAMDAADERDLARAALAEGRSEDAVRHSERAEALWSGRDATLAAGVEAARRSIEKDRRRRELAAAYVDLHDGTLDLIDAAEARARPAETLTAEFEKRVAAWRRDHPGDHRFVAALDGWLRFLCGDEEGGKRRIEEACAEPEEDPIGLLYRGRISLADALRSLSSHEYTRTVGAPALSTQFDRQARRELDRAAEDFRRVADSGIFGSLRRRREMELQVEGWRAMAEGRYAEADELLLEIQELPGIRRDVLRARGIVALFEGRYREAVALWERVFAEPGSTPQDRFLLGETLLFVGFLEPPDAADVLARAVEVLGGNLRGDKSDEPFLMARGAARHMLAGRMDPSSESARALSEAALDDLDRALALCPADPGLFSNRGKMHSDFAVMLAGLGEDPEAAFDRSERDLKAAIELDPAAGLARDLLSLTYIQKIGWEVSMRRDPTDTFERCLAALDAWIGREPRALAAWLRLADVRHNLGKLRFQRGGDGAADLERALAAYAECERIDPGHAGAAFETARVYSDLATMERARGGDPRDRLKQAAEAYERAPGSGFELAIVHSELGFAERLAGGDADPHWGRALAAFDRAIQNEPQNWNALLHKGLLLIEWGRPDEARAALEEARRLAPDEPAVLEALRQTDF